jgi:hypothetical protein
VDPSAFPADACPHVAMLLSSSSELPAAPASFSALGARRTGRLYYPALEGRGPADRAALMAAGLDVDALEAEGRMVFAETRPEITVEEYVQGWEEEMQGHSGAGSTRPGARASRSARTPRTSIARSRPAPPTARPVASGADAASMLQYDRAWDAYAHDRRYVSLCISIVGEVERDRRSADLRDEVL